MWLVVAALGLHLLEEFALDVNSWIARVVPIQPLASEFYAVNGAYVIFGVASAAIGWRMPAVALMTPSLCIVNALFMHILGTVVTGDYSPGLLTSVVLFLPVSLWAFWMAHRDGVLTWRVIVVAAVGGTLLHLYPIILLALRHALAVQAPVH